VNLSISFIFKYRNEKKLAAVKEVYGLIKACRRLNKAGLIIDDKSIPEAILSFKSFERRFQYLNLGIPEDDFLKTLLYMIDMIKSFFLLDLHLLNSSYKKVIDALGSLEKLYQYVGTFDMAISAASLKSDKSIKWCKPELTTEKKVLQFTNATHPLIEQCVPNSINLRGKSAFITGSNMSGKSTFLRTVLINVLLAQTLYVCFAESFTTTLMSPSSCINIDDDLLKGSSYFFMEVEVIKKMTEQIPQGTNNLFVIDEVFKGTNTVERISLAKAILNYLNNLNNIVIASSHDLELISLLSSQFDMFYFSETIQDDVLHFDHTIKPGYLKTTNAIKMVALEDFPKSIVDEAYEMAGQFKNERNEKQELL
jgi:DNA mismatch repair ATPase MutS